VTRKPPIKPRKQASQRRSRAMVDALIEATARVLVREGFDGASTNRIAEVAGVSVGSLYQYYPGKEALVAAVIERHNQKTMNLARSALAEIALLPVEQAVRRLVAVAIEAHRIDPRLHRVLAEQIPRAGRFEDLEESSRQIHALFKAYLESRRDQLPVDDLDLATFVCVTTIEALAHTAVLHHPKMPSDDVVQALVDETTRLVAGYLQ